jgi:phosphomannomutase
MSPFDYVNDITYGKKGIMVDDIAEKNYNAFIINRSLSYHNDTVLFANEMNIHHTIDNRLQYDFFINIIRKQKRWSKWMKPSEVSDLDLIKEYYGYSNEKAKSVLRLLNDEQINELKNRIYKGGKRK